MTPPYLEIQKFRQWWLILPFVAFTLWIISGLLIQLTGGEKFGTNPMPNDGAIIFILGWCGFLYFFFWYLELRTEIDSRGIRVRLRGIMTERLTWSQIEKTELITYGFVGYGMRLATRYGTVYNISGNQGLAVYLKDGSRFLVGTNQPEKLLLAVQKNRSSHSETGLG
jgi:hypothetical protein